VTLERRLDDGETIVITKKTGSMARGKRPQAATRRPASAGKCRCGQDLDVCSRGHCPRCGSALRQD
jgi:hypothetical protein